MKKLVISMLSIALLSSGSFLCAKDSATVCRVRNVEEVKNCKDGETLFFDLKRGDLVNMGGHMEVALAYFCDFHFPFFIPHDEPSSFICIFQRKVGADKAIEELTNQDGQK